MAVLKQRLHKKNSSGTYDTVHLETSANLVKRTDGTHNVEESLSAIESWDIIRYDDAGVAPITPIDADTLQGHPASYFAVAGAAPTAHTHSVNDITDMPPVPAERVVVQSTDDAPASMIKGSFSIGPSKGYIRMNADGPAFPDPSSHTPGDTITWDNKSWLVCHYDSITNRVYLIASDTVGNTNFGGNATYSGSTLASVVANYQTNQMSAAALAQCVDITVNGVTSKVFVPSYEQMNGGFSWFNSDAHRTVSGAAGYYAYYWTSSAGSSSENVWDVQADGRLKNNYFGNNDGFRPCVCVQLSDNPIKELAVAENYYTKSEIDNLLRQLTPQPPSSHTPGDIITWYGYQWLVCHYDSSNNKVYLITKDIIGLTVFGNNSTYAGSTLASLADQFKNELNSNALSQCAAVIVNGVTSRVFVPSYEQMNGGFSWFNNNTNRIAYYNGSATIYWTSSAGTSYSNQVWRVLDGGSLTDRSDPSNSHGFRPCVCVQL